MCLVQLAGCKAVGGENHLRKFAIVRPTPARLRDLFKSWRTPLKISSL